MAQRTCTEGNCGEPATRRNGMCDRHFREAADARKPRCSREGGCEEPARTRSLCELHYDRWRRTGSTELPERPKKVKRECSTAGCRGISNCRGMCTKCYWRWRKYGDPTAIKRPTRLPRHSPADIDTGGKACTKCKRYLPLDAFGKRSAAVDGLQWWCKDCQRDYYRERYQKDPEFRRKRLGYNQDFVGGFDEYRRQQRRAARFLAMYGITQEQLAEMVAAQGGVCKICGDPPPEGKPLVVDHDHETGAIRGALCGNCNSGLGYFRDDPERLRAAIRYLEEFAARQGNGQLALFAA